MKMKPKNMTTMLAFIILALALASSAYAENITYTYKTPTSDVLVTGSAESPVEFNVTLPDTSWTLDLLSGDMRFRVSIPNINATDYPELEIRAVPVNLSIQNYDGVIGNTSGFRYRAKYAYAFNISQLSSEPYTAYINYSGISISYPVMFKCNFSFVTNKTNTSECVQLGASAGNSVASAATTGFSSFFLAEDTGAAGAVGPGSLGGGGGGGGGARGPITIYISPTPEGVSAQVYSGDRIVVQYKGAEYTYKVNSVGHLKVELVSVQTGIIDEINMGSVTDLSIPSLFEKEVAVSMHISNQFAILTFKTKEESRFSFPLLPPRPRELEQPEPSPAGAFEPITVVSPIQETPSPPGAAVAAPPEIPIPESPIGIWTIIFSLVFVMFLVGGMALYRTRLHRLEKPPTVTRTGLETAGLPETSSEVSEPAPISKPQPVVEKPVVKPVEVKKPVEDTKQYNITREKKLELEKYIFHAYSLGFKEEQVVKALIAKGWPESVVRKELAEIKFRE